MPQPAIQCIGKAGEVANGYNESENSFTLSNKPFLSYLCYVQVQNEFGMFE